MTTHTTELKKKLESERDALITQLQEVGRINPTDTTDWEPTAAPLDINQSEIEERALEITSFEDRSSIEYELEVKLAEVNKALESIANGTYGVCTVCNANIEEERLSANPAAATCKAHME